MSLTDFFIDLRYKSRKHKHMPHKLTFGDRFIYDGENVSEEIMRLIGEGKPCMVTRFGWTELSTLLFFLRNCHHHTVRFRDKQKNYMKVYSGFINPTDYNMARFCCEALEIVDRTDLLGVSVSRGDEKVLVNHGRNARLINLDDIGNMYLAKPWTPCLKGKKVLVVHPFAETIKKQYLKREKLFPDPDFLPEFELKTYKAVQTAGDAPGGEFRDWFEALDYMRAGIREIDFDIALIAAGAYGMFLADYCKHIGKQAIHVGGALQLFFGVSGERWDSWPVPIPGSYPEENRKHWVRPSDEERIAGQEKVEGSCYW